MGTIAQSLMMAAAGQSVEPGQAEFTSAGTYAWTAPNGVSSVSVLCVGGGAGGRYITLPTGRYLTYGGAGGDLVYSNSVAVIPGNTYTVVVGAGGLQQTGSSGTVAVYSGKDSTFNGTTVVAAGGSSISSSSGGVVRSGGNGGAAWTDDFGATPVPGSGGGGAGGYSGNGGTGGSGGVGSSGSGGGGGGGGGNSGGLTGGNGGGVGIYGEGASGAGGSLGGAGGAGSSGSGQLYGGGGRAGVSARSNGASGAVRIIWGAGRAYPSTNTADL